MIEDYRRLWIFTVANGHSYQFSTDIAIWDRSVRKRNNAHRFYIVFASLILGDRIDTGVINILTCKK